MLIKLRLQIPGRYIKLHNHNILNKNDMLIMIDLPFVLLIWVLTDAKRPWVGLRCIHLTQHEQF